jgi:hypothetical protein
MRHIYGCLLAAAAVAGLAASSTAGVIANPSFEENGVDTIFLHRDDATGWSDNVGGEFGGSVTETAAMISEGLLGVHLFSTAGTYSEGDNVSLWQLVDLTAADSILFDYSLRQPGGLPLVSFLRAAFLIDGAPMWVAQEFGEALGVAIPVDGFDGVHRIELRLEAVAAGSTPHSVHFDFDNLRVTPPEPPVNLPQFADLIYHQGTGQVRLRPSTSETSIGLPPAADGRMLIHFLLQNDPGGAGFNPGPLPSPLPGFFSITTEEVFFSGQTTSEVDLGNIFPTGLSREQLDGFLTNYSYGGFPGSGLRKLDLVIVPEPSAAQQLRAVIWTAILSGTILRNRGLAKG